jgi:hypothetical protein
MFFFSFQFPNFSHTVPHKCSSIGQSPEGDYQQLTLQRQSVECKVQRDICYCNGYDTEHAAVCGDSGQEKIVMYNSELERAELEKVKE